ncbi:MAG TPA: hypothetical protein VM099_16080 [Gemmatimonadaceae bacterium]|nr:hypothetical protein [Gemmatimonadaceae bacterium]
MSDHKAFVDSTPTGNSVIDRNALDEPLADRYVIEPVTQIFT